MMYMEDESVLNKDYGLSSRKGKWLPNNESDHFVSPIVDNTIYKAPDTREQDSMAQQRKSLESAKFTHKLLSEPHPSSCLYQLPYHSTTFLYTFYCFNKEETKILNSMMFREFSVPLWYFLLMFKKNLSDVIWFDSLFT